MKETHAPFAGNSLIENIQSRLTDGTPEVKVGARIRTLRNETGLSLRALAELSGLNVNTLSLIENERTSPSVSTLQQIAHSLKVPISAFFEPQQALKLVVYQKNGKRTRVLFSHGSLEDLSAGMRHFSAELMLITLNPHTNSGKESVVHTGWEFVFCLDGAIGYCVDDQTYILEQGDSLMFEAHLPHRWQNHTTSPARMLLVLCPMDLRDQPSERHFGS